MSLCTTLNITGTRLIEIAGTIGGMVIYAEKSEAEIIGIHALSELRKLHKELGIALERFEADHPGEVARSRNINRMPAGRAVTSS